MSSLESIKQQLDELKSENARLRNRLQIDPGGSDKIDELEQAMEFLRHDRDLIDETNKVIFAQREKLQDELDVSKAENKKLKDEWQKSHEEVFQICARLKEEVEQLRWTKEVAEAKADVCGGEWCAKNRAEGRGPCGACAWCVARYKTLAERALVIAEMPYKDDEDIEELRKIREELQGL